MRRLVAAFILPIVLTLAGCSWLNFLTGGARNSDEYQAAKLGNPVYPDANETSRLPSAQR